MIRIEAQWDDVEDVEFDEEGIREEAEEAARAHMRRKGLAKGENLKGALREAAEGDGDRRLESPRT